MKILINIYRITFGNGGWWNYTKNVWDKIPIDIVGNGVLVCKSSDIVKHKNWKKITSKLNDIIIK